MVQKEALKKKFGDAQWDSRKRLSPDAIEGIRSLHAQYPDKLTTPVLAQEFEVSPEVIRRILKGKWRPTADEMEERRERWERRGEKIWTELAKQGTRPPKKWRMRGIGEAEADDGPPVWKQAQISIRAKYTRGSSSESAKPDNARLAKDRDWEGGYLSDFL